MEVDVPPRLLPRPQNLAAGGNVKDVLLAKDVDVVHTQLTRGTEVGYVRDLDIQHILYGCLYSAAPGEEEGNCFHTILIIVLH